MYIFLRFRQLESFRYELTPSTSSGRCGPRRSQGGCHLNSAKHKFSEIKSRALVGSPQIESSDKRIQQASYKNAEAVTWNVNFEQ